jgi:hypothetical protein
MSNTGLISEQVIPRSLLKGGMLEVRRPDASWADFLPDFEAQSKLGLETMNCVQFSFLNVLEAVARFYGRSLNLSDRFLYWASGCTARGNTYSNCIAGFLKHGCCAEEAWSWLVAMSREEYGTEPPEDIKAEALRLFEEWELHDLVYVSPTVGALREALKTSPLWFCNSVHSMMMYAVDDRIRVFDTYGNGIGSFPLDYVQHIEAAYIVPFYPKKPLPLPMTFTENTLYQYTEPGSIGGFFLFAKGRLYRDRTAELMASWNVRNGVKQTDGSYVFNGGKVGTLTAKQLEGVQLYNLKDEPVTLGNPI